MEITFPISGVHTYIWLPLLAGFCVSYFTSMVGISGAFLLLPFQMTVLGFVSPAVSGTNMIFNIIAAPGGILGFLREKRVLWPVAGTIVVGSLPGILIGGFIRLHWLPNPEHFKIFVGLVLLYIGSRLLLDFRRQPPDREDDIPPQKQNGLELEWGSLSWRSFCYRFQNRDYSCNLPKIFGLSLIVGVLGATYGIGGGAIIAPFLATIYRLPIHTIAGATLVGTFTTSLAGATFYELIAPCYTGLQVRPDWMLGILFGLGGCCGAYLGSCSQRYVSASWLKIIMAILILFVAADYLVLGLFFKY